MKTSKLRVTGLCEGNSPVTGEFPAQRACNEENVSFDDVTMKYGTSWLWLISSNVYVTHTVYSQTSMVCCGWYVDMNDLYLEIHWRIANLYSRFVSYSMPVIMIKHR